MQTCVPSGDRDDEELDDPRVIRLECGFNFRDVGGLRTTTGACVRRGKVYRSDDPLNASTHDIRTIARFMGNRRGVRYRCLGAS